MPKYAQCPADLRHILRSMDPALASILGGLAGDSMGDITEVVVRLPAEDRDDLASFGYITYQAEPAGTREIESIDLGIIDLINEAAKVCASVSLNHEREVAQFLHDNV